MRFNSVEHKLDPRWNGTRWVRYAALCALVAVAIEPIVRPAPAQAGEPQSKKASSPARPDDRPANPADGPITDDNDPRVKAALARASAWLRGKAAPNFVGETALVVQALAKIRAKYPELVPADDPAFERSVAALVRCCQDNFKPSRSGGHDNYEAGCAAMALAAVDAQRYAPEIGNVARYILSKQLPNGAWHYSGGSTGGDTSQTQYAILGLWAASASGVPVPKDRWDRAANWLVTHQGADGGFAYHPPAAGGVQVQSTHTMTVGSLGSLYICRDHLPRGKRRDARGVLLPVRDDEPKDDFKPQVAPDAINTSIARATAWLVENFTLDRATGEGDPGGGRFQLYYLYAFERFATLAEKKEIAGVDWYSKGAELLLSKQEKDGAWRGGDGDDVQTSFAVLFLLRSTRGIVEKDRERLRGGVLEGGEFTNLSDFLRDARGIKVKPIPNSAGKIIEIVFTTDTDVGDDWQTLADFAYTNRRTTLGEQSELMRKVLQKGVKEKDSRMIKTALKGLAFTGDYRVVPLLIDAMYYEEHPKVQLAARDALCLISRTFPGPYAGGTSREAWQKEIDQWKAWYRSVRPEAELDDE